MDKKNTTIGVLLLIAAFAGMIWFRPQPAPRPVAPPPPAVPPAAEGTAPSVAGAPTAAAPAPVIAPVANGFYALPAEPRPRRSR